MKKIILSICSLVVLSLLYYSCSKDDIKPNKKEGSVEFGFSLKAPSHSGVQKSSMKTLAVEPAAIVVSIKKANGNSAYNMQKVDLYNMNGYYISKPLSFLPGSYTVEQFFVVDAAGNVMYATPLQGSPKTYLVSQPLPISFTVSKDAVTKIVPEVLSTEGSTPEDFGYSTFSFEVVKTFDFLIGVFVYNESTQNFELTNANLTIIAASKTIFTDTLAAITNKVTLNDGYDNYLLTVTKDGYKAWTDTLTATELKLYFRSEDKEPLKVILEKGCNCPATVTDIDGNVYQTVVIGTQCWMKENLKTTKYNDGTPILNVTNNTTWGALTTGAYCNYNNDTNNVNTYGRLYNWFAATDNRNICPLGWHVPSDNELHTMVLSLDTTSLENDIESYIAGSKLKEIGTSHWISPNIATNESVFTALPGGVRSSNGLFYHIGLYGFWWSSTNSICRLISHDSPNLQKGIIPMNCGLSVRCVKD
ncbi:MAG: fibrobacter succinogenes major paralogous domain-containing protein [Bacteroidales bacterium]|nr:fibrobacter succinogenes major paralogous domain-containing protein [Bacteroidales bacterium]